MSTQSPQVVESTVVLVDEEVAMAKNAVKRHLTRIRSAYRRELRNGNGHYAGHSLRRFDAYLDLYERLGGDPDEVRDIEDGES